MSQLERYKYPVRGLEEPPKSTDQTGEKAAPVVNEQLTPNDVAVSLDSGETLLSKADLLKEAGIRDGRPAVVDIGRGVLAYHLPYSSTPQELRIWKVPERVRTLYPQATEPPDHPNVYQVEPTRLDPLKQQVESEARFVRVKGAVRLKQELHLTADGHVAGIMDVEHDAETGFPITSILKVDGRIRKVVRNMFEDDGRLISQTVSEYDAQGGEVASEISTYQYLTGDNGNTYEVHHETTRIKGRGDDQATEQLDGTSIYDRRFGFRSSTGIGGLGSLYAQI